MGKKLYSDHKFIFPSIDSEAIELSIKESNVSETDRKSYIAGWVAAIMSLGHYETYPRCHHPQ